MPRRKTHFLLLLALIYLHVFCCILALEFSIDEELAVGSIIGNVKTAYYDKQHIETAGKKFNLFQKSAKKDVIDVDEDNGNLLVKKRIDREAICADLSICRIEFSVYLNSNHDKVDIQILVNDINDFTPAWKDIGFIQVEFRDGDGAGIHKAIPLAQDQDLGKNASLDYRFQNAGSPFTLRHSREEGKLYIETSRMIDREEKASYNLSLIAYDNGSPSLTGSTSIVITITDINDNYPVFTKNFYSPARKIFEDEPIGSEVLRLEAEDKDTGDYGRVTFRFGSTTNKRQQFAKKYFTLTPSGKIKVKKTLDYDRLPEKDFIFEVVAHDNARDMQYRKSSTATVSIAVLDKIDEKPTIKTCFYPHGCTIKPTTPKIKEDTRPETKIAEVEVQDLDTNDHVKCSVPARRQRGGIMSLPKFKLKLQSAGFARDHYDPQEKNIYDLVTDGFFDREESPRECFVIECVDSHGNSNEKQHCIEIEDVNDNEPQVKTKIVFYAKEEDSSLSPIDGEIKKFVEDKDLGINKELRFMIDPTSQESSRLFSINENTGQLIPKVKFDREKKDTYYVKVIISDKGKPSLSSTADVNIRILDANDQFPVFTQNEYTMHVTENQPINTFLGKVEAHDPDLEKNGNGMVLYKMAGGSNEQDAERAFKLDAETGEITTREGLDREQRAHYTFMVTAEDRPQREQSLTSTARVTVLVKDQNDNKPVFKVNSPSDKLFYVTNKEPGHNIGHVKAVDPDEGQNQEITYQLMNKIELGDYFDVDPRSGLVLINKALHGLPNKMFQLKIQACDNGHPRRMCSLETIFQAQITDRIDPKNLGNGMNSDHKQGEGLRSGSNEGIIVCLTIVFVILVVATISLVCLIRRKSMWIKKQRQQAANVANANQEMEGAEVKMISGSYDLPPSYKDYSLEEDLVYKGTLQLKKTGDGRNGGKRHFYATTPRIVGNTECIERPMSACSAQQEYQSLESGLRLHPDSNRLYNNSLHMYYEIKQGQRGDDEDGLQEIPETMGTFRKQSLKMSSPDSGRMCVDGTKQTSNKSARHYPPFSSYTEASFV